MGKYPRDATDQAVIIQLPEGQQRLIPLDWTDQGPVRPRLAEARLVLNQLQLLRQQVDELLSRQAAQVIIASKKAQDPKGGNDGAKQALYLAEPERGTTATSAGGPGADVTTTTEFCAREA